MRPYCRVGPDGIAHLFSALDYGRICSCGRKIYAFTLDTEEPTMQDLPQQPVAPWTRAATPEKVGNARFLL